MANRADIANVEIGAPGDEGDDAEILAAVREMPPLSSCTSALRFWCHVSFAPALFVGVHLVVITSLAFEVEVRCDRHGNCHVHHYEPDSWALLSFRTNTACAAALLLLDACLIHRAALFLERDIRAMREEASRGLGGGGSQQEQQQEHVFGQASQEMDRFFGRRNPYGGRPFVPVLVSLLHLLAVACSAGGLVSATLRAYAFTSHFAAHCAPSEWQDEEEEDEDVPGLPGALQQWAKTDNERGPSANFAHLSDGRTFFVAQEARSIEDNVDDSRHIPEVLAATDPADSASPVLYPDVEYPSHFSVISGNKTSEGEDAFCCLYYSNPHSILDDSDKWHVLCAMSFREGMRNTSLDLEEETEQTGYESITNWSAIGFGGAYWFRVSGYKGAQEHTKYYKVDPEDTKVVSFASVTVNHGGNHVFDDFGKLHGGACARYLGWIAGSVALLVAIAGSLYLRGIKNMPNSAVPLAIVPFFVLSAVDKELYAGMMGLAILATSVSLILRPQNWAKRESVTWIHYSLFLSDSLFLLSGERIYKVSFVWLACLLVGITLGHPILQVLGWLLFPIAMLACLIKVVTEGGELIDLFVLAGLLLLGCGMVNAGRALRKYRAYIYFYARRTLTAARGTFANGDSVVPETAQGEDISRRLLD